jgi:hypothetical protein
MIALYEITQGSRHVTTAAFGCMNDIIEHIRTLSPGFYDVHKELPRDPNGVRNSEYLGQFTKHVTGEVTYSPVQDPASISM